MNFQIFKELFERSKFISSNYALTNLFGFVKVRVSDLALVILPSPILELQYAPLPPQSATS